LQGPEAVLAAIHRERPISAVIAFVKAPSGPLFGTINDLGFSRRKGGS